MPEQTTLKAGKPSVSLSDAKKLTEAAKEKPKRVRVKAADANKKKSSVNETSVTQTLVETKEVEADLERGKLLLVDEDEEQEGVDESEDSEDSEESEEDSDVYDVDSEIKEAVVSVRKTQCLECKHLVPFATKKYTSCHYSQPNNEECPASSVKIVIKIDTEKIIRLILRLKREEDVEGISNWYAQLASKPQWMQKQILDALSDAEAKIRR
jgi:hypothetical protein